MRILEKAGYGIKLTEEQYQMLLGRFDVNKAIEEGGEKRIKVACICDTVRCNCNSCPLRKEETGCGLLLRNLVGRRPDGISLWYSCVEWETLAGEEYVKRVHDLLLEFNEEEEWTNAERK